MGASPRRIRPLICRKRFRGHFGRLDRRDSAGTIPSLWTVAADPETPPSGVPPETGRLYIFGGTGAWLFAAAEETIGSAASLAAPGAANTPPEAANVHAEVANYDEGAATNGRAAANIPRAMNAQARAAAAGSQAAANSQQGTIAGLRVAANGGRVAANAWRAAANRDTVAANWSVEAANDPAAVEAALMAAAAQPPFAAYYGSAASERRVFATFDEASCGCFFVRSLGSLEICGSFGGICGSHPRACGPDLGGGLAAAPLHDKMALRSWNGPRLSAGLLCATP